MDRLGDPGRRFADHPGHRPDSAADGRGRRGRPFCGRPDGPAGDPGRGSGHAVGARRHLRCNERDADGFRVAGSPVAGGGHGGVEQRPAGSHAAAWGAVPEVGERLDADGVGGAAEQLRPYRRGGVAGVCRERHRGRGNLPGRGPLRIRRYVGRLEPGERRTTPADQRRRPVELPEAAGLREAARRGPRQSVWGHGASEGGGRGPRPGGGHTGGDGDGDRCGSRVATTGDLRRGEVHCGGRRSPGRLRGAAARQGRGHRAGDAAAEGEGQDPDHGDARHG